MNEQLFTQIEKFLAEEMNETDKAIFQTRMNEDKALMEEVVLQKNINAFLREEPLEESSSQTIFEKKIDDLRNSDEGILLKKNIKAAGNNYFDQQTDTPQNKTNSRFRTYLIAASVAIIVCISLVVFNNNTPSNQELYATYYTSSDLPTFVTRGTSDAEVSNIVSKFNDKEYDDVLELVNTASQEENSNPLLYIYSGMAQAELGKLDEAINQFELLENSNSLDASRAYWYKALVYLDNDAVQKAKEQLQKLVSTPGNYKFAQAKELLEKL